jgi:hypothetical protein
MLFLSCRFLFSSFHLPELAVSMSRRGQKSRPGQCFSGPPKGSLDFSAACHIFTATQEREIQLSYLFTHKF